MSKPGARDGASRPGARDGASKSGARGGASKSDARDGASKSGTRGGASRPGTRGGASKSDARDGASELRERELRLGDHPCLALCPPEARALYVFAHGAGAGMRHAFMATIAGALAARGVATLRWEFPYMAAGRPRPDRPEVAEAAVREVWDAAAAEFAGLARFAGGMSFGGRMTSRAHAARPLAGLRGIVFLSFPLHPPDQPGIERAEHLAAAAGPLLFVQGDRDELAGLRRLRPVVHKLGERATLHVAKGADHGFHVLVRSGRTRAEVLDEIVGVIARWITVHAAGG